VIIGLQQRRTTGFPPYHKPQEPIGRQGTDLPRLLTKSLRSQCLADFPAGSSGVASSAQALSWFGRHATGIWLLTFLQILVRHISAIDRRTHAVFDLAG
jgi:hypothetical protein